MRVCFSVAITNPLGGLNSKSAGWRKQFHRSRVSAEDSARDLLIPTPSALKGNFDGARPHQGCLHHHG